MDLYSVKKEFLMECFDLYSEYSLINIPIPPMSPDIRKKFNKWYTNIMGSMEDYVEDNQYLLENRQEFITFFIQ